MPFCASHSTPFINIWNYMVALSRHCAVIHYRALQAREKRYFSDKESDWRMSVAGGILGPGGPDLLVRMRGRAVGAIVCAGFGGYAMYWWTEDAIQSERSLWFGAIAVVAAILIVWAITNLVALSHEPKVVLDKRLLRFYRIGYALIVAIEGAAISVGGPILGHFHRPELFGQWIGAVVGIHFFPLGKLFKLPLYYWTGAAISLTALGSLLISPSSLSSAVCAGGTGVALWITATVILSRNLESLSARTAPAVATGE
jgi:hypothetical protein